MNNSKFINDLEANRLSDKVYYLIKERIINLSFKPREQLVEMDIARELGVSKSPIRDAFQRLEREKLVNMIPYKGWYVQAVSMEEFRELCEARQAIETYCLERTLTSYTDGDFEELKNILEFGKKELDKENSRLAFEQNRKFHLEIVRKVKNNFIESFYLNLWDKHNRYSFIIAADVPGRIAQANQQHFELIEVFKKKDVPVAVDKLRAHLLMISEDRFTFQKYWENF